MENVNTVSTYKDTSKKEVRYGIHYEFNNSYSDTVVRKMNEVCDEIIFRGAHFFWFGKYPKSTIKIGGTRKVHDVILDGLTFEQVKKIGNVVAKYLKVSCEEEKDLFTQ